MVVVCDAIQNKAVQLTPKVNTNATRFFVNLCKVLELKIDEIRSVVQVL